MNLLPFANQAHPHRTNQQPALQFQPCRQYVPQPMRQRQTGSLEEVEKVKSGAEKVRICTALGMATRYQPSKMLIFPSSLIIKSNT